MKQDHSSSRATIDLLLVDDDDDELRRAMIDLLASDDHTAVGVPNGVRRWRGSAAPSARRGSSSWI